MFSQLYRSAPVATFYCPIGCRNRRRCQIKTAAVGDRGQEPTDISIKTQGICDIIVSVVKFDYCRAA
jgi:hypothetical protein